MIRPDIEGLKALAEKATHQSWAAFTDDSGPRPHTNLVSFSPVTDCAVSIPGVHKRDPNIAFIGAANPAQVLALIAYIEELESRVNDLSDGSLLASAPAASVGREEIARVMDPRAFDHPTVHPQHLARRRKAAMSKADAILTLLGRGS